MRRAIVLAKVAAIAISVVALQIALVRVPYETARSSAGEGQRTRMADVPLRVQSRTLNQTAANHFLSTIRDPRPMPRTASHRMDTATTSRP
jgi:hypothetical protein